VTDYLGTYEEYVHASGNDHLDADTVILKARREKRQKARERRASRKSQADRSPADIEKEIRRLERDRDEVTASLERDEARVAEIDAAFCEAGFYERTTADEVSRLESERSDAQHAMDVAMERWSAIEARLEALSTSS